MTWYLFGLELDLMTEVFIRETIVSNSNSDSRITEHPRHELGVFATKMKQAQYGNCLFQRFQAHPDHRAGGCKTEMLKRRKGTSHWP